MGGREGGMETERDGEGECVRERETERRESEIWRERKGGEGRRERGEKKRGRERNVGERVGEGEGDGERKWR